MPSYPLPWTTPPKIIGRPGQGTHTRGDWASDNAYDFSVPVGTPVYAVADGKIGSQIGPLQSSDPALAGSRLHLIVPGDEWYYAHLSRIVVIPGQTVKAGQLIGYSGSANGTPHLHLAARSGDPMRSLTGSSAPAGSVPVAAAGASGAGCLVALMLQLAMAGTSIGGLLYLAGWIQ